MENVTPIETISQKIFIIRGFKVMLDSDLAKLYEIKTSNLNLAVKRNPGRFPQDFSFQLTEIEQKSLMLQIAISKGRGGQRKRNRVFTEHGVAMLSSILQSEKAVQMNIFIVRAFIKIREFLATHKELAHKIDELEHVQEKQGQKIDSLHQIFKGLLSQPQSLKEPLGFTKPKSD